MTVQDATQKMVPAKMKRWCRLLLILLSIPFVVLILFNCAWIIRECQWEIDLLRDLDSVLLNVGLFQILVGIFICFTMGLLVCIVLSRGPKRDEAFGLLFFRQQTVMVMFIVLAAAVLFFHYPSLENDATRINNAMSKYGKEEWATKLMDTAQRELQCCGVYDITDWKNVDEAYLANSSYYKIVNESASRAPITCAANNETFAQFHDGGCLDPLFIFHERIAQRIIYNYILIVFIEVILAFMIRVLEYLERDGLANERELMDEQPELHQERLKFPEANFMRY